MAITQYQSDNRETNYKTKSFVHVISTMINIFHDIVRMFPMKSVHIIHVSRYNLVAKVSSFRTIGYGEIYMPNVGIRTLRADEIIMGQFNVTPLASGLK